MYKGAIFDLDDTLYDYETNNTVAITELCRCMTSTLNISDHKFMEAFNYGRNATKNGLGDCASQHNRIIYFQKALEFLNVKPSLYALEMYDIYWGTILNNITLNNGVIALFEYLRKSNAPICICTDLTAHIQHRKIRKLGLEHYIDVLVTSEEAGVEKPNPRIFELCLKKLELNPSEVFYVGDSFKKDIIGASNVGIQSFWYNPKKIVMETNGLNHIEVDTFDKIVEVLQYETK